jgi:hypothetical protein
MALTLLLQRASHHSKVQRACCEGARGSQRKHQQHHGWDLHGVDDRMKAAGAWPLSMATTLKVRHPRDLNRTTMDRPNP